MSEEEPKIIIDEDWKSQVERERSAEVENESAAEAKPEDELTEAGLTLFDHLISTLAAQTISALGLLAQEGQERVVVDLNYAKHVIDSLMMLREKTKGNLSKDETKNLDEAISELQRVFAARATQSHEAALNKPGIDPDPSILNK